MIEMLEIIERPIERRTERIIERIVELIHILEMIGMLERTKKPQGCREEGGHGRVDG